MLVHNYCSLPLPSSSSSSSSPPTSNRVILFSIPFLTFLDLVFLHKIFVKTYTWSAAGVFVAFGGSLMPKKDLYIYMRSVQGAPFLFLLLLLSSLPLQGRSKRLFPSASPMCVFIILLLRGYYAACHTFLLSFFCCTSVHDVCLSIRLRIRDSDKWLNTCSYWVIIGLWKH